MRHYSIEDFVNTEIIGWFDYKVITNKVKPIEEIIIANSTSTATTNKQHKL